MKRWSKLALTIAILLVLQELLFRWCFPLPELSNFDRANYQNTMGRLLVTHLRDQTWTWTSTPDTNHTFAHEMNRYGFRDTEWTVEKPAGKKRVMLIGDSFVEGVMASQNETVADGFQNTVGNGYEVMNMGMLGVGVESYLQLLVDAVPIFKPEVVVLTLYANDFTAKTILPPQARIEAEYHSALKPRALELISLSVNNNAVPSRFSDSPESFLPPVGPEVVDWQNKERIIREHCAPDIAAAMLAGNFNYFKVNQLRKEEMNLKKRVSLAEQLRFAKAECAAAGAQLVVCYVPARAQVTDYYFQYEQAICVKECPTLIDLRAPEYHAQRDLLARDCQRLQLPLLDFTQLVFEQEKAGNHLYWNYEDHMRGKGYLLLGENMARFVTSLPSPVPTE